MARSRPESEHHPRLALDGVLVVGVAQETSARRSAPSDVSITYGR